MYIRSVHLENIRCIERLDLAFEEGHEAGWHVLIGENGSGKTTVARAIALGLVGTTTIEGVMPSLEYFSRTSAENGKIYMQVTPSTLFDELKDTPWIDLTQNGTAPPNRQKQKFIPQPINLILSHYEYDSKDPLQSRLQRFVMHVDTLEIENEKGWLLRHDMQSVREFKYKGWFTCGFGPFRRFRGGNNSYDGIEEKAPLTKAILSLFLEDAAFTEIESWLKDLRLQEYETQSPVLSMINRFINEGKLLPNGVRLEKVSSEGVFFVDSNHNRVNLHDLSDGYRSVLSLTFELLRQLLRCYGEEKVFANIQKGEMTIPVPGVVIIDEVDAHLHPTWQTKIGQWFTKYFPSLQFIVTTHSPLICRACGEHGKIFRLAAPGSKNQSGEITGVDRDRLVYGDILAAYETDAFGDKVEWGQEGRDLQKEYRDLAYKRRFGVELTEEETKKYERLKAIFKIHVEAD